MNASPGSSAQSAQFPRGFTAVMERTLRRLWALDGKHLDAVAEDLHRTREQLDQDIAELVELGLVRVVDDHIQLVSPRTALTQFLEDESSVLETTISRLVTMAGMVTRLGDEAIGRGRPADEPATVTLDAIVTRGLPPVSELRKWVDGGGGDLRFLRPQQWRLHSEPAMLEAFTEAVRNGHEVRCIYPMETLRLARSMLDDHAAIGEQVRLLPDLKYQMSLIGDEIAVINAGLGTENNRTMALRDNFLVRVFDDYFEQLWDRAIALPVADESWDRDDERRLILAELARGQRDEQIARSLGLGLRTVRRRVAELMIDLGAETRFQAGVEAVRHGWV